MFILILLLVTFASSYASAETTVGLQGGFSSKDVDEQDFQQYGLAVTGPLPWTWEITSTWSISSELIGSAGALTSEGKTGFIGSLGPRFLLSKEDLPVQLDLGISPTLLGKRKFEDANFGSHLQFTSHIGILFLFGDHWYAGYRFQHMSNASISSINPGLNIHLFQLNRRF
jgi:hypothetical protein